LKYSPESASLPRPLLYTITMFKTIINFASTIQARRFASAYKARKFDLADRRLETYKTLRRMLPIAAGGNHWGNHNGSKRKPYRATQGL